MPHCNHCDETFSINCEHIKERVWDQLYCCYSDYYYCNFQCLYSHKHSQRD